MEGSFRDWLNERVGEGDGMVSRHELARRIAGQDTTGTTDPENVRRSLRRIMGGQVKASQPTRDAIQKALNDHTAPSVEDEDSDDAITRELVVVELEAMIASRRREIRNLIRYRRLVVSGGAV